MELTEDNKILALLSIRAEQYEELNFRRNREYSIFQWTSTILLAICAILLGINDTEPLDFLKSCHLKIIAILLVGFIGSFSVLWQNRERKFCAKNCRVIASINESLGLFKPGAYFKNKTVLPLNWKDWGGKDLHSPRRFFRTNYITATWILSGLTILLLAIS